VNLDKYLFEPAFVILAGVRSDGIVATYTSVADVVASASSPEALKVLTEPRFETPMPVEMGLGSIASGPMAALWRTCRDKREWRCVPQQRLYRAKKQAYNHVELVMRPQLPSTLTLKLRHYPSGSVER
jgi:hypothetical protein